MRRARRAPSRSRRSCSGLSSTCSTPYCLGRARASRRSEPASTMHDLDAVRIVLRPDRGEAGLERSGGVQRRDDAADARLAQRVILRPSSPRTKDVPYARWWARRRAASRARRSGDGAASSRQPPRHSRQCGAQAVPGPAATARDARRRRAQPGRARAGVEARAARSRGTRGRSSPGGGRRSRPDAGAADDRPPAVEDDGSGP